VSQRPRFSILWLLTAAPVAYLLDRSGTEAALVFLCAGLALVPLAKLIVDATEQIAERVGPALGGLLNATFGNLPELIIALMALRAGLFEMVRASMIGALLANLLLAQGVAFILGGRHRHEQEYNPAGARTYGSILLLAALSMIGPASFHQFLSDAAPRQAAALDVGVACVLLCLYGLYLVFVLKTHPDFFRPTQAAEEEQHEDAWSVPRAVGTLVAA
jgi:Ca2+:H+ antiporter